MGLLSDLQVSPLLIGLLSGLLAGYAAWQVIVRRWLTQSRYARRFEQVMADGREEVEEAPRRELEDRLLAAGLNWGPGAETRFHALQTGLVAGALILGLAFNLPLLVVFLGAVAGYVGPIWYLGEAERKRAAAIDKEIPAALTRIGSLVKIQPDVAQLLALVADSLSAQGETPLAQELRRTAADVRSRREEGLLALERRAASVSLANLAFSLQVFMRAGGEFAPVMADAAQRSRKVLEGRQAAMAKAQEAIVTSRVLPLLLIGVGFAVGQDPEILAFYRSGLGQMVIAAVLGLMVAGHLVIQRMIDEVV